LPSATARRSEQLKLKIGQPICLVILSSVKHLAGAGAPPASSAFVWGADVGEGNDTEVIVTVVSFVPSARSGRPILRTCSGRELPASSQSVCEDLRRTQKRGGKRRYETEISMSGMPQFGDKHVRYGRHVHKISDQQALVAGWETIESTTTAACAILLRTQIKSRRRRVARVLPRGS
jgi:hypothetical protein